MNSAQDMIQQAASFDWDALLPVIFFLLYGISQLFGRKKKKEDEAPPDEDALERARQIREEIRRKVEARKQASRESASRPEYDPTVPDGQQRRPMPQQGPSQQSTPQQQHSRPPEKSVRTESPAPAARKSEPRRTHEKSLEEMLKEQQRQVEESRKKVKEARMQAQEIQKGGRHEQVEAVRSRRLASQVVHIAELSPREQLLIGLQNPYSARQAIVYREVLGKPLGLK